MSTKEFNPSDLGPKRVAGEVMDDASIFEEVESQLLPAHIQKAIEAEGFYTGAMGTGIEGGHAPKSWFNDPFGMLDGLGVGYKNSPSSIGYSTLASMAEKSVVPASIIQTRVNQVSSFTQKQRNKYSVGWVVRHRDPKHVLSDGQRERLAELEFFIEHMGVNEDPERDNFDTFVRKVVRDRLTFDQVNSEKVLRRNGKPHSLYAVPADTIRIASPPRKTGTPLSKWEQLNTPKYVQVVNGEVVNDYLRDEMIFRVANPRTSLLANGYGMSELELLITTITAHLWAEEWNRRVFSQGATVKGILNITGNVKQQALEAFRRQWITQVSGVTNAWRSPVMNADNLQWIPLQPSNSEMGYQQWMEYLIKVSCAVFLIDPAEINFDIRGGVGQQPMFMSTNEAQQKVSKDRGLQPLLRFIQTMINEEIIWRIDPAFEFAFVGLDSKTEEQAIELRIKELGSYKTLNEVRREADDLEPIEGGDLPMNPVFYTAQQTMLSMEQMKQQQAQMAAQSGQPGAGGEGQPQQKPEMAPKKSEGEAKGDFEQRFGKSLTKKSAIKAKKPQREELSEEETSEDWESTIRASLTKKSRKLMKKALSPLREF